MSVWELPVRNRPPDYEDEIPLGHAVFLLSTGRQGAEIIPELSSFQADGRLFKAEEIDASILDEELLSSLDHLRDILRAKAEEEERQS